MLAASDSVSSYDLCSVDVEGLTLLVSSIQPGSNTLLWGSLSFNGKEWVETSYVGLSAPSSLCCNVCRWVSAFVPSAAGRSFSDGV